MKRAYLGVLLAVVLPAISVCAEETRGGGGHGISMSRGNGGAVSRSGGGGRAVFARSSGFHGGYHGVYGRGFGRGYYYRHGHGGVVIAYGYGYYPYGYYPYGYVVPVDTSDSAVYPPSVYSPSDAGYPPAMNT